uniref:Uncharacterized protein n=1 Tax=Anguilla anguilla TaxID=7936 RepID=A0A0E9T694_ANGAN
MLLIRTRINWNTELCCKHLYCNETVHNIVKLIFLTFKSCLYVN